MYVPKIPPGFENEELRRAMDYVREELQAIGENFSETDALELRERNAAPVKPREGMIVKADGTNWDPGEGAGTYLYTGSSWTKVGLATHTHVLADVTDAGDLASLDEVTLSDMADLANQRVIGRNTAGTGVPEALTIATVLSWLGNTRGDTLRRGSSAWEALALGSSGQVLKSDGTDTLWGNPSSFDLLDEKDFTASDPDIEFTDISTNYKNLVLIYNDVSLTAIANLHFQADLANDFASLLTIDYTYLARNTGGSVSSSTNSSTDLIIGLNNNASGVFHGVVIVFDYNDDQDKIVLFFGFQRTNGAAFLGVASIQSSSVVDNVRLHAGSGDMDGGHVKLFGWR